MQRLLTLINFKNKMKVNSKLPKFQEGGPMPSPDGGQVAPADQSMAPDQGAGGQEQDPIMQIAQVAAEALQTQNCEAAFAVCEAFLQLAQQAGGGAAPEAPQEPTFQKKGGRITRKG